MKANLAASWEETASYHLQTLGKESPSFTKTARNSYLDDILGEIVSGNIGFSGKKLVERFEAWFGVEIWESDSHWIWIRSNLIWLWRWVELSCLNKSDHHFSFSFSFLKQRKLLFKQRSKIWPNFSFSFFTLFLFTGQLHSTWTPILRTIGALDGGKQEGRCPRKVSQRISTWFWSISFKSRNSSCNELWGLQQKPICPQQKPPKKPSCPKLLAVKMYFLSNVRSLPLMETKTW